MSFKKNKYQIIKKSVPIDVCNFLTNYLIMKEQVLKTFYSTNYISRFNTDFGNFTDIQSPNTYSCYGDPAMEVLLEMVKPTIEKQLNKKLVPTYSYVRLYRKGDKLEKHIDRKACEVSATLHLGGEEWPFYIEAIKKPIKINLKQSDMLIYRGQDLAHWRNEFKGDLCAQVFLHYNYETKNNENIFDQRPHLGLPNLFCKYLQKN